MGLMPPDRTPRQSEHFYNEYTHTLYHSIYHLFSLKVFWSSVVLLSQPFLSVAYILLVLPVSLLSSLLSFLSLICVVVMTWPGTAGRERVLCLPLWLHSLTKLRVSLYNDTLGMQPLSHVSMICR